MVVVPCNLLVCHPLKICELDKLRRSEYPFRSYAALTMKNPQHVLNNIELFHFITFDVKNLLVRVIHISYSHLLLLLQTSPYKIKSILHDYRLNIFIYWT